MIHKISYLFIGLVLLACVEQENMVFDNPQDPNKDPVVSNPQDSNKEDVVQDAPTLELNTPAEVSIKDSVLWLVTPSLIYGTIVQYEWDCDGPNVDQGYVKGESSEECAYATAGTHTVYSRVTDDDDNVVVDSSNVVVVQDMPTINSIDGPSLLVINEEGTFTSNSSDVYGNITQYEWDTGDGYVTGTNSITLKWVSLVSQNIKLRVTDDDGNAVVDSVFVGVKNHFTDARDGHRYLMTQIGTQVWMAENLAYLPQVDAVADGSEDVASGKYYYVYDYIPTGSTETEQITNAKLDSNYQTDGVLYNWNAAMDGATSSILTPSGIQGVCPSGWHLPSDAEWTILNDYVDANNGSDKIGNSLKATTVRTAGPTSTDQFGFSALPAGYRDGTGGFYSRGGSGYWWSASEFSSSNAYYRGLYYGNGGFGQHSSYKSLGFSVRCLEDTP